ncbi:MAG: hypothetical protein V4519_03155 [Patescibacteria group bacterium]
MKKMSLLIAVVAIMIIVGIIAAFKNTNTTQMSDNNSGSQSESRPMGKIVAPQEMKASSGDTEFVAANSLEKPSEVVAMKGTTVLWKNEVATPTIDPNLEKDVQLLDFFVTKMRIDDFKSQPALYVTIGTGVNTKLYVLNPEDGKVLNIVIVSPPPAQ